MLFVIATVLFGGPCEAQDGEAWAGAWGRVQTVSPEAGGYQGERLQIYSCDGNACALELAVKGGRAGHCDSERGTQLVAESATKATAHLGGDKCTVALTLSGSGDAATITTKAQSAGCADYCTAGMTLDRTFALRARTHYVGDWVDACFAGTSRARMAICGDAQLAKQEQQWLALALQVGDLAGKRFSMTEGTASFVSKCDAAAQPAACLATAFTNDTAGLRARQAEWTRTVSEPGDASEARVKMAAIVGRYRHSFTSGDVQGDTFKAVDNLTIRKISDSSIAYRVNLHFYNGHMCSRSGTASYRQGGMFADQVKDDAGLCVFEIVPDGKGVALRDPTFVCRLHDCGMRGGYNGAGFTFAEKQHSAVPRAASKQ